MKKALLFLFLSFCSQESFAQYVVLGTGTAVSVFSPVDRHRDYSVYEIIYLQNQVNMAGSIGAFDIQRVDGSNTDSIENVRLYMKHTSATTLSNANYDTSGYTLVFTGSFPNDAGSGWRGVQLDTPFVYNNLQNLQVLIVKDYQPAIANTPVCPRWYYTATPGITRARRYYGYVPITTSTALTTTTYASNARLTFNAVSVVEVENGIALLVYPNPSHALFNIIIPADVNNAGVVIKDLKGAVVFEKNVSAGEHFSTPVFSSGMYLLQLIQPGGKLIYSSKLIVE